MSDDTPTFERYRPDLLALGYRMLGDLGRAEDAVQEAWVRWQKRKTTAVDAPKAFLLTTMARLCLDDLGSARRRREESRSDRLPEPVSLEDTGLARVEMLDQISLAFLVLLQRLTPSERAVFLLHEVFAMSHAEIGVTLGKSEAASRQLLKRAKTNVARGKKVLRATKEQHLHMLGKFVAAIGSDDPNEMLSLLADDAILIVDAGPRPQRYGKLRNVSKPVVGKRRVAALIRGYAAQSETARVRYRQVVLNGQPAMVTILDGRVMSAMILAVVGKRVHHVFFQNDPARLRHVGTK